MTIETAVAAPVTPPRDLRFERVHTGKGLRDFVALTDRIYRGDPKFVPPLRQQLSDFMRGKNPYVRQGAIELWVVRNAHDEVVARTSLHTNAKFDAKLGRALQLFGFTEFVEDYEVFDFLVRRMRKRAELEQRDGLFGPAGLLPNQAGGVITSGFDERGFIDSAYNPPYYPEFYERAGFARRFEADTWICDAIQQRADDPDSAYRFDDARIASEGLELHFGNKRKVSEQLPIIRDMLNASFAQLGYYTQIDADELAHQTDGLSFLLDESLVIYLTREGAPIAFVLCIPDISEYVAKVNGNLNLPNQLRLLAQRGKYRREAVLIIKGTVPEAQGKGYMNLLSRELLRNLQRGGYDAMRSTYVERENLGSASAYGKMGGRPLHGYTFYELPLS